MAWSQAAGFVLLLLALPVFSSTGPTGPALAWGAAAGVGAGSGVALLYRGLARGRMSVVAPITAVEAAAVAVLAGALDQAANVLYLLATRRGMLSLVAVLTSLYPASTVLLARLVLGERLARLQVAGLVCAAGGVGLIATG